MVDHIVALHDRMIGVQNIDFKIEITTDRLTIDVF